MSENTVPDLISIQPIKCRDYTHKLATDEITCQRNTVGLIHLSWNRKLDVASKLRAFANLARFDGIPQGLAVCQTLQRAFGQHGFGMNDFGPAGEIVVAPKPTVGQSFSGAKDNR